MNNVPTIDQAIGNAEASIHMEGLRITDEYRELCRRLLKQEISFEYYLAKVKADIQK